MQAVLTCPQLPDRFYTRLFVSAVNRKTELQGVWAENGHGVREALLGLKYKEGTSRLRIGSFLSVKTALETVAQLTLYLGAELGHESPTEKLISFCQNYGWELHRP